MRVTKNISIINHFKFYLLKLNKAKGKKYNNVYFCIILLIFGFSKKKGKNSFKLKYLFKIYLNQNNSSAFYTGITFHNILNTKKLLKIWQ